MLSAEYDLRYLKAGLDQLEKYLLSKDVYRPIGIKAPDGTPPYPQLTLGWLLLTRLRIEAISLNTAQTAELDRLVTLLEATRQRWRSAWSNKAQAEFRARLNLWRDFLEEYRSNPGGNYERYAYEVNRRVLLDLLQSEADRLPEADQQALNGLDLLLREVLQPGDFIWDELWIPSFPKNKFWYLYGQLKK